MTPVDITRSIVEELGGGYFSSRESYVLVTDRIADNADRGWNFRHIKPGEFFTGEDLTSQAQRHLAEGMLRIPLYQFISR